MKAVVKIFLSGFEAFFNPMTTRRKRINVILNKSDEEALRSDWEKTGNDIKKAMVIYEQR